MSLPKYSHLQWYSERYKVLLALPDLRVTDLIYLALLSVLVTLYLRELVRELWNLLLLLYPFFF